MLTCGSLFSSRSQIKTFQEACVMVRKPALELFTYLKNSNFAHPVIRYVICIFCHSAWWWNTDGMQAGECKHMRAVFCCVLSTVVCPSGAASAPSVVSKATLRGSQS